jgi:hypothetical protein
MWRTVAAMEGSRVRRIAVLAGLAGVLVLMMGVTTLACVTADSQPCRSLSNAKAAKTRSCRGHRRDHGKAVEIGLGLIVAVGSATFLITRLDESSTSERNVTRATRSWEVETSR